mmetsp:Transcript_38892/g.57388  ORF Transcript_38892/g.57388 Transcript_38892/m.57388 type:complete len:220 (-) Transcript_38892:491-1150(-)
MRRLDLRSSAAAGLIANATPPFLAFAPPPVLCTSVGTSPPSRDGNPMVTNSQIICGAVSSVPFSSEFIGGGTACPITKSRKCLVSIHTPANPPVASASFVQMCNSACNDTVLTLIPECNRRGSVSPSMSPGSHVAKALVITIISRLPYRGAYPKERPATSIPFCKLNSPPTEGPPPFVISVTNAAPNASLCFFGLPPKVVNISASPSLHRTTPKWPSGF